MYSSAAFTSILTSLLASKRDSVFSLWDVCFMQNMNISETNRSCCVLLIFNVS